MLRTNTTFSQHLVSKQDLREALASKQKIKPFRAIPQQQICCLLEQRIKSHQPACTHPSDMSSDKQVKQHTMGRAGLEQEAHDNMNTLPSGQFGRRKSCPRSPALHPAWSEALQCASLSFVWTSNISVPGDMGDIAWDHQSGSSQRKCEGIKTRKPSAAKHTHNSWF